MIYEEMLEIAKSIHPNARVRPSADISRGTWEIYIPTAVEVVRELPERFDGTPAAFAASNGDSYNTTTLARFSRQHGYERFPIDCAADYYNLEAAMRDLFQKAVDANGGDKTAALDEVGPQFTGMRAMLDMTWLED
jgi:hypothetical protein